MQPDPKADVTGAKAIVLAGKEWLVPILAIRQARVVVPAIMRLMPRMGALQTLASDLLDGGGGGFPEGLYDDLVDTVHGALTRAYPTLTKDAFLDLPISTQELVGALQPIMEQTMLFKKAGDVKPGEAPATTKESTSTASSPAIAPTLESLGPTISNGS